MDDDKGPAAPVSCSLCGVSPPGGSDQVPITWVTSMENGVHRVFCAQCAREHVRSIESKLDSEWW
ncbi:MAG: hypothetical protein ACRDPG_12775 [Nocardioidaceae bacterium]